MLESNTGIDLSMLGSNASVVDSQNEGAGAQVSTGEVPGEPSVFSVEEGDGESANMEEVEEASSAKCLRLARDPSMPESNAGVVDYQNEGAGAQVTTGEIPGDPSVLSAGEGGPESLNKEGEEDTSSTDSLRLPRGPSMLGGNASVDDYRNDSAGVNDSRMPMDPPEVSAANETDQDSRNKEEESLRSIRKTITGHFRSRGESAQASGELPGHTRRNLEDAYPHGQLIHERRPLPLGTSWRANAPTKS